jgi:hypothetical protein
MGFDAQTPRQRVPKGPVAARPAVATVAPRGPVYFFLPVSLDAGPFSRENPPPRDEGDSPRPNRPKCCSNRFPKSSPLRRQGTGRTFAKVEGSIQLLDGQARRKGRLWGPRRPRVMVDWRAARGAGAAGGLRARSGNPVLVPASSQLWKLCLQTGMARGSGRKSSGVACRDGPRLKRLDCPHPSGFVAPVLHETPLRVRCKERCFSRGSSAAFVVVGEKKGGDRRPVGLAALASASAFAPPFILPRGIVARIRPEFLSALFRGFPLWSPLYGSRGPSAGRAAPPEELGAVCCGCWGAAAL